MVATAKLLPSGSPDVKGPDIDRDFPIEGETAPPDPEEKKLLEEFLGRVAAIRHRLGNTVTVLQGFVDGLVRLYNTRTGDPARQTQIEGSTAYVDEVLRRVESALRLVIAEDPERASQTST